MFFAYPEGFNLIRDPFAVLHVIRGDNVGLGYVQVDPEKPNEEAHSHDFELILMVLKGSTTFWIDGETRTLKPMDAVHIPAGIMHKDVVGPEGCELIQVVGFPPKK